MDSLTFVDRWILYRLHCIIEECRRAYEDYDYQGVFRSLRNFCRTELSNVFVDVTKDRLYCDAAESPRRRSTQTAMHHIISSIARLAAPILPFTTEEVWSHFRPGGSIHQELLPVADEFEGFGEAMRYADLLLPVRALLAKELESARLTGKVGDSLEARVEIEVIDQEAFEQLGELGDELEEFLIVSEVSVKLGTVQRVSVDVSPHSKCARCWRYDASVGAESDLCLRCASVLGEKREGADEG